MPDRDIGALATTVRTPFEDRWKPDDPFGSDYDPAITNAITGLPQLVHQAKHQPPQPAR